MAVTTIKLDVPVDELFRDLNDENTFVMRLFGKTAYHGSPKIIAEILVGFFGYQIHDIHQIYRYERPGVWRFKLASLAVRRQDPHGKEFQFNNFQGDITNANKQLQTTYLHWAPPAVLSETIRKIASTFITKPFIVKKANGATDRWLLIHEQEEKIPHYIETHSEKEDGNIIVHIMMLVQPGRRQVCRHCGESSHWTTACPSKRRPAEIVANQQTRQMETESEEEERQEEEKEQKKQQRKQRRQKTQQQRNSATNTSEEEEKEEQIQQRQQQEKPKISKRAREQRTPSTSPATKKQLHETITTTTSCNTEEEEDSDLTPKKLVIDLSPNHLNKSEDSPPLLPHSDGGPSWADIAK